MKSSIQRIHHAVQLISFFSNSYLQHQSDDSHTNFKWNPVEARFMSQFVDKEGFPYLSICAENLKVYFCRDDQDLYVIDLQSFKAKDMLVAEIHKGLESIQLKPTEFKEELHYELPKYIDLDKVDFKINDADAKHFAYLQDKAYEVIGIFQAQYSSASELRLWPHHFDHSILVEIENNGSQLTKSISLGLGIPDNYVDEPYFYVTHWSKNGKINPRKLGNLPYGNWLEKDWLAAVLPHSQLHSYDHTEHVQILYDFFLEATLQSEKLIC